jgi:nicotinate-nucleotide adenylyltransferase
VRIGLFGGTFDPPHVGHLLAASDAFDALALDRLVFIPNAVQPLKETHHASSRQRLEMVRALIGDDRRFDVDPIEIERTGLSYTVDTLAAYAERYPHAERFLLVGADVLASFAKWREPARVRELAELVVLQRGEGGVTLEGPREAERALRKAAARSSRESVAVAALQPPRFLETRRIDVSSTEIRERVRSGKSIHGFVPDAVAAYVVAAALYR